MKTIFNSKRFLSIFLAVVMLLGMIPLNMLTAAAATVPSGYTGIDISAGSKTITSGGKYYVYGSTTTNQLIISGNISAEIILDNVTIKRDYTLGRPAIGLENGANVTLKLSGINMVQGGATSAGIYVPEGTSLTITSIDGDGATTGSLEARARASTNPSLGGGAGIGTKCANSNDTSAVYTLGSITIKGGTVQAYGAGGGAGIGGGYNSTTGSIRIEGGHVTAGNYSYGLSYGACIGGGSCGYVPSIEITGGTVITNSSGGYSAAIGTGYMERASAGSYGTVKISGGNVMAGNGGGNGAYAIGVGGTMSGTSISGVDVQITGGSVTASSVETPVGGSNVLVQKTLYIPATTNGQSVDSITFSPDYSYGLEDVVIRNNRIYLWLPEGTTVQSVTVGGTVYENYENDMFCNHKTDSSHGVEYKANADGLHHDVYYACCDMYKETFDHDGGTAYCNAQAVCTYCGAAYGNKNPDNHTNTTSFNYTMSETEHTAIYKCCGIVKETVEHSFDGYGVCVCGYEKIVSGVAYIDREYNSTAGQVMSSIKGCETYTTVTADTTTMSDGWYVVDGNVTVSSRITVSGTVHLILKDNSSLTASNGIAVNSGNNLYIYGQREGTGKLTASWGSTTGAAAIGGNISNHSGTIVIDGGIISATGRTGVGIGGGSGGGSTSNIVINGGQITATSTNSGAAIGGGEKGTATVAINGGTIDAKNTYGSKFCGAAIGSGYNGSTATVTIRGGSIKTANSYGSGGHIGGYLSSQANAKNGSGTSVSKREITLSGAASVKVTAVEGLSGYDLTDVYTDANGKLYFWLPSTTELPTSITAGGKTYYNDGNGNYAAHEHSFTYKNDGDNKIVATCSDSKCDLPQLQGNGGYLTVTMPTGNQIHTGAEIKPATITYSDDWTGSKELTVSYDENMALGTATGTLELGDAKIEVTFDIVAEIKLDANGGNGTFDSLYTNTSGELQGTLPTNVEHNSLFFTGWADSASGGNEVTNATVFTGSTTIYAQFVDHQHNYTYKLDDANKIVATCSNEDTHCPNTDGGYVTITAEDATYTGSAIEAVVTNTLTTGATPVITYSSTTDDLVDDKPVYAGDYTAKVTVGGKEISVDYTIGKATPTVDDFVFTAPTDLTFDYTEKEYTLKVKDGIVGMGTVYDACYSNGFEAYAILPGTYKVQIVNVLEGDNYTAASFLKSDDWTFTINYLETDATATVSGTVGTNGWYTSVVALEAPKDYTISKTANGEYNSSVSYNAEQNETVTYYLKNANGEIAQKTVEIKIDLNAPTAQYKIGTDGWKQFINTISFGLFCKDYKTVEIEYSDTESGVATKQYYIAATKVEDTSKIAWSNYTDTLNLNATGTYFVYMRVVDNAGREVILNSEGIVIYEDSVAVDTEVKTTYGSTNDVTVTVDLKGNTITDVKSNGQSWITDKNACTVNGNTITLKGSYVKKLGAGTYPLTVYYAPQGVETDKVTITTTFNLVIDKAKLTIKAEDKTATYGDAVPSYTVKYTGFVNGDGEVSLLGTLAFDCEYKQFSKVDSYTITPKGLESNNYEFDYQDGTLTVSPKEITVTIQSATSVYGDDIAELKATDNGIVNNDKNVYSLATTATKTSDIDTYNITGTDTSDNYVVTFVSGTNAYTIKQRELTVTVVVADKKYDGLNNATITSAKLNNVVNNDQIILSNGTATFASVDVADGIAINFTQFSISGDKVGNYKLTQPTGVTANITNGWNPVKDTEYTTNGSDWRNTDFVITAKTGYALSLTNTANGTWVDSLTGNVEGTDSSVKFFVKNTATGAISEMITEGYKLDKVAPTGKVEFVERTGWEEFVNTITFGLFYDSEVTVKVSADDKLSGIAKIEYASSDKAMTLEEVKEIEDWTEYTDSFGITYEEAKQFVYFIRITDNAGNVTYLSSDGAEYDNTDPVISGVENGKTYYTTQKVTVTDKNIDTVTVNNVAATTEITLDGNVGTTYTIVATDKAKNVTTVTVTMKPISDLSKPIDDIDTTNVNSSNEQAVDKVKADVTAVDTTNATDAEKEELKAISDKATELEKVIDDTKAEIARITEEMAKYDDATVNSDDAQALEQLGKDIKALTDGGNLTEAERTALTEDAADVTAMQKIVTDTTTENDRISDKVDEYDLATVTSDDKADLEQLLADIEKQLESTNLTDEEKSELNGDKKAVEDLLTKIKGTDELIDKLTGDVDGYSDETVKSTDKDAIEQIIEDIDALLDTENLTEDEEKALEDAKAKAEGLLDTIDDAADATESENTEKVKDVTAETVTPEDKTDLEKAKEDLEKALEDYGDNYTEDEKKSIEDEIKRIDDALEVIGNVEKVEELIDKLPDTIKKDDADAIKAADDAYNTLTDYEKSLVDEDAKKALDDAKAALAELNKPKDPNSPATGDNSNMFLWIALLFISGGAVITLTVVDRKKKAAKR